MSRGEGKSAVGLAAYMTGETMKDELTGKWCNRNHPGEVLGWGTVAPSFGPAYLSDDKQLSKAWNAVEKSETRINSHVANHWNIASSREFSEDDHIAVATQMANAIRDRYGVMVTWAVHKPTDHGDDRNWHIHLGYNMRRITEEGFGAKAREITAKESRVVETIWQRKIFADTINERLELIGSEERVSHETYARQGKDLEPTKHLGNDQNQLELKGVVTMFGDENRDVRQRNAARAALRAEHSELTAKIYDLEAERAKRDQGTRKMSDSDAKDVSNIDTSNIDKSNIDRSNIDTSNVDKSRGVRPDSENQTMQPNPNDPRYQQEAQRLQGDYQTIGNFRSEPSPQEKMRDQAQSQQQKQAELASNEAERVKKLREAEPDNEPRSAGMRWAAAQERYNPADHWGSMARSAGTEFSMFMREQEQFKKQMDAVQDPTQKRIIELAMKIEGADYMNLVYNRHAGNADVIAGYKNSEQAKQDKEYAEIWKGYGNEWKAERKELKIEVSRQNTAQKEDDREKKAQAQEYETGINRMEGRYQRNTPAKDMEAMREAREGPDVSTGTGRAAGRGGGGREM